MSLMSLTLTPGHAREVAPTALPACKDPQVCFRNKRGKAEWAKDNDCTFCAVTIDEISKVWPGASSSDVVDLTNTVNGHLREYSLDTPLRLSHFFAQARQETGPRLSLEESFYYRPRSLMSLWPSHFTREQACQWGMIKSQGDLNYCAPYKKYDSKHGPDEREIANHAYGGRFKNGPVASGNGWKFRGRGIFMNTGKSNYADAQEFYNKTFDSVSPVDFVKNPELLQDMSYAVPAAVAFWKQYDLYKVADSTDTSKNLRNACKAADNISVTVNGGNNGKEDRCIFFKDYWKDGIFAAVDCSLPGV